MRKIITDYKHHLDDYECMWNGIEDLYMHETNEKLPNQFFFAMSGFCGFAYLHMNKAYFKRLVTFGEGRTKQLYQYFAPIAGFDYHFVVSKTPQLALAKAKKEIDQGYPVVIGALDMYYLEYFPSLYHQHHIPFHYVLMIGYDDELRCIYLHDCGREQVITLSYENLMLGMNAKYPGLSEANTICTIRFFNPQSMLTITKNALTDKADRYLNPKTGFLGIKGIKKLAKELPDWESELGLLETQKIINNMVMFMGSVPQFPNRLLGKNEPDDIVFQASRDKMSKVMQDLSVRYQISEWEDASKLFTQSGLVFAKLCDLLVDYLLKQTADRVCLTKASSLILTIGDLEKSAYQAIQQGLKNINERG